MSFKDLIQGLLHEPDFNKRKYYPDKLAKLGDWNSTEYLGQIMNSENEPIALRIECSESLGKQGDPRAIEYLIIAIQHTNTELRRTSLWSLGQIGTEKTADIVMGLVKDPEFMIQKWVVKSLGRIRSPKALKYLSSLIENYFEHYEQHLHLILKAVLDRLEYADSEILQKWLDRTYFYFQNSKQKIVQKNSLLLQYEIFKRGLVPEINFLESQLKLISSEDKILCPHLIRNLGFHFSSFNLEELQLDEDVVIALSIRGNTESLVSIIKNYEQYDAKIISSVLENLSIEYDCSEFLHSQNDDIRFAALNYHARFGLQLNLVHAAIEDGVRINYLLDLLQYLPIGSIELMNHYGIRGSKPQRQSIVQAIGKINYDKFASVLPKIIELLSEISQTDKIWHIRRDARIIKQQLVSL